MPKTIERWLSKLVTVTAKIVSVPFFRTRCIQMYTQLTLINTSHIVYNRLTPICPCINVYDLPADVHNVTPFDCLSSAVAKERII